MSHDAVQTFAYSPLDEANQTTLGDITGKAKYSGHAGGTYVHETKNEDGTPDTATSGTFTADAEFDVDYDGSATWGALRN